MSGEPARLHPDDIRAIAAEVARELGHRPRAKRDERPRPTVTPEQQQKARAQLERLGLVGSRR